MDTFLAIARRLTFVVVALLLGTHCLPVFACSASYTQAQAVQACQAFLSSAGTGSCTAKDLGASGDEDLWDEHYQDSNGGYGDWEYCAAPAPPSNPCSSLTNSSVDTTYRPGDQLGTSGQTAVTDPATGAKVYCPFAISYSSPSGVADAYGHFHIHATLTYSGNPAGGADAGASTAPQFNDPAGNPLSQQPTATEGASPTLCAGGSCYDPNANQYCGVSGGSQFCLSGAQASSSQGGCASGGGATLCAGSPSAPMPNPTANAITDPATQISSSDKYTQSNVSTGATSPVTVNVYSGAGASPTSGASSGSLKASNTSSPQTGQPASSSSTGSSDSYGGGGDCNTPPVCQGDAVLCGVTLQQWRTMCSAHTDMQGVIGDGKGPPTFQQDASKYSQADVWQSGSSSTDGSVGGQANAGNYDSSGFGYSTACPLQDLSVPFGSGSFVVPFSEGCVIGPWLRAVIIGFALFSAAVITAGGRG